MEQDPRDSQTVELDGTKVHLYRSSLDGKLVIDIDTYRGTRSERFDNHVPRLRIYVNDDGRDTQPDGSYGPVRV